jgi:hypothetical protein
MIGLSPSEVKSTFLMKTIGKNYRGEDEKIGIGPKNSPMPAPFEHGSTATTFGAALS